MSESVLGKDKALQGREKVFFFISYQKKKKTSDISKNTIPGWIRALLQLVYSNANKDMVARSGRSTHAIRSIAASLTFSGQVDLDEVFKNCYWKCHTTLSEFYLKDMTQVWDDLLSLGPGGDSLVFFIYYLHPWSQHRALQYLWQARTPAVLQGQAHRYQVR